MAQTNTWEEEDAKRGRKELKEGHKGHAEALFIDAHDSQTWKGGDDGHESPVTMKGSPLKGTKGAFKGSFMSKHSLTNNPNIKYAGHFLDSQKK
tara:strand:- start:1933 stop:2214 length:282 start_codon:yes stop_codon:yes gene_type:complete